MSKSFTLKIESSEIKTTVVTDESELEGVLKLLFSIIDEQHYQNKWFERLVGLGIEKSFSSTIDGVVIEKVAVLKLCVEKFCLIVHLIHFKKIPTSLHKFLDVSDITVVGVGIKQNLCDLRRDYGIQCRNAVVELGDLAALAQKSPIAISLTVLDLCKFVFGVYNVSTSLAKSVDVAFGDWGRSLLSEEQIIYATREVCVTFTVAKKLWCRLDYLLQVQ
jgi:hypothetical protein